MPSKGSYTHQRHLTTDPAKNAIHTVGQSDDPATLQQLSVNHLGECTHPSCVSVLPPHTPGDVGCSQKPNLSTPPIHHQPRIEQRCLGCHTPIRHPSCVSNCNRCDIQGLCEYCCTVHEVRQCLSITTKRSYSPSPFAMWRPPHTTHHRQPSISTMCIRE